MSNKNKLDSMTQRRLIDMINAAATDNEIVKRLSISQSTVKRYRKIAKAKAKAKATATATQAPSPVPLREAAKKPVTSMITGPLIVCAFRLDTPLEIIFAGIAQAIHTHTP